jgi:hypothetical protein
MAFLCGYRWRGLRKVWALAILVAASLLGLVACATSDQASVTDREVSQIVRANEVLLAPLLQGGTAGWCLRDVVAPTSRCDIPEVSDGAIFAEGCNARSRTNVEAFALTPAGTDAVSVAGGPPVRTRRELSLATDLRSAWVELHYQKPPTLAACPKFTPTSPIIAGDTHHEPLGVLSSSAVQWRRTNRPGTIRLPRGACEIGPADLPGFQAQSGAVVKRLRPARGLFGEAFASCASEIYLSATHASLAVAILTDAARPGSIPGPLPGMRPIADRSGTFEADGPGGELVARRLPGAWLVVQEGISGLREALTLLSDIQVTIKL